MKQLSALDNLFFALEKGSQPMHIACLGIYDPSTAEGGKVRHKQILAHYAARLEVLPIFQRRLVKVPFDLDLPYWVDQGQVDVEYHVRHIALPHPGDWRQLMIQVARLHSRPLDQTKPLWETYVIEGLDHVAGLPKGCFAIYTKLHHALVDGESTTEMLRVQHDLEPVARPIEQATRTFTDREPNAIELISRAIASRPARWAANARTLGELGVTAIRTAGKAPSAGDPHSALEKLRDTLFTRNPQSRFSGDVSPHRVVSGLPLPLEGFAEIRGAVPGVTINDVFLAVAGGAVRKYLAVHGELPATSLYASVPISVRGEARSADGGNRTFGTMVDMGTSIDDPLARLRAVHDTMVRNKHAFDALGQSLMGHLSELLAPVLPLDLVQRHLVQPRSSIVVSNVRGPNVPLYFAGARLVRFMPLGIPANGVGLSMVGFSYDGQLWVCVVSCRKMMPDPAHFEQCIEESFSEMRAAAGTQSRSKAAPRRRKQRSSRAPSG